MTTDPVVGAVRADTAHALLARVAKAQATARVPSLVTGVVRDGELVWSAARGRADPGADSATGAAPTTDTQYRIGSLTKGFTAVLVMRLRDEGALALDDTVGAHVPDAPYGDATIRDLLAHAAGLAAEPPGPWWERSPGKDWLALAAEFGPELRLGGHGPFHYSNPGYALLGRLVEVRRGRPWFDVLRDEVLVPLGMTRTTYAPEAPYAPGIAVHPYADVTMPEVVQDLGAMAPAGQLWSTIADLARWAAFVIGPIDGPVGGPDGGPVDSVDDAVDGAGTAVLSAETRAEMRAVAVLSDDATWQTGYGLGFQVFRRGDRTLVGHGGSVPGYLAFLVTDPERGTGAVEVANGTSGSPFCGVDLLEILERHEPYVMPAWRPADVAADLVELTGLWHWGPNPLLLRITGADRLELSAPGGAGGRASRFRPRPDGTWVGLDGYWRGEPLRVVRRADGSVSHLDLGTFVWTRRPYDPDAPIPGGVAPEPWG